MRSRHVFWSLLVLAAILGAARVAVPPVISQESASLVPAAAPALDAGTAAIALDPAGEEGEVCGPENGAPSADLRLPGAPDFVDSSCCIPRCRRDRDCDSFCGGKGLGACIQVNSCCKDCACFG